MPLDFPAVGAPEVRGKLAGKLFKPVKTLLRASPEYAQLLLYSKRTAPDACSPQFAPDEDDLYIDVQFPGRLAVAGARVAPAEPNVHATYKQPKIDPVDRRVALAIDAIDDKHATGRLLLVGADDTDARGSFDAVVCASPQRELDAPPPIHGLPWGGEPVEPKTLPQKPLTATILGKTKAPAVVEVVDWQTESIGQHEIHIFVDPPAHPCAPDQLDAGIKIGLPGPVVAGAKASLTVNVMSHAPFAEVLWRNPGNVIANNVDGALSVIVDSSNAKQVRGRVYAWFRDPSKALVVGAFVATRCKVDL
jgi:hypothetical protein